MTTHPGILESLTAIARRKLHNDARLLVAVSGTLPDTQQRRDRITFTSDTLRGKQLQLCMECGTTLPTWNAPCDCTHDHSPHTEE